MSSLVTFVKRLIEDPDSLVDSLLWVVQKCDLKGKEISYMFLGGMGFILISQIGSFIFNFLEISLITDSLIKALAQIVIAIIFIWFVAAFVTFLWIIFVQPSALTRQSASTKQKKEK